MSGNLADAFATLRLIGTRAQRVHCQPMALALSSCSFAFAPAAAVARPAVRGLSPIMQEAPTGRAFAETMPGVTAPFGLFDPAGFLEGISNEGITMYREAELAHCRVSMIAALGFLVQENFHPVFPEIGGPASRQLDLVLQGENGQAIMATLLFGVMLTEITRARIGWQDPEVEQQALRPEYTPGDLGFDPLGMAPKDEAGMLAMKNKELNNGRLAMIALAGICAQEVISGTELLGSA